DELKLAHGADLSEDVLRQQEEVRRAEVKLEQMTSERDSLMERLKLERERLDLRSQVCLLKESKEAVEEELKARSTALVQNTEDVAQQRAEASALSREREISSLRRQLDPSLEELAALRRDKEVILRENRRLQDDLATMTRENQEQENRDLLERFRMVHSGIQEREQKLHQAEGLNNSIRLELLSSDTERRQLRDTVGQKEREIQKALQAYEVQVSSLARGMSRLEEELHKAQEEKAALLSDLASIRELCVKLDSAKDLTARQLTSKSMDLERHAREVSQLRGKVSQLQTEMDVLKRQLTTERFERERAVQEMRRQGLSFSSPLSLSGGSHHSAADRSILRSQHSTDKSTDKYGLVRKILNFLLV
ncbi:hypothetical protein GOODEAATRI_011329, partial [Goodea atripinnis]